MPSVSTCRVESCTDFETHCMRTWVHTVDWRCRLQRKEGERPQHTVMIFSAHVSSASFPADAVFLTRSPATFPSCSNVKVKTP